MSDLDRQVEDMIAAAALDDDAADELRAAIADVKARRDARLRGDVQRTVGETHLTLREGMDRVIGLQVDTQGMVSGVVRQLEAMEAAADQLRREFHGGLAAVGERLSGFKITLDEHTDTIHALLELGKQWERRWAELARRVDQHDTALAAHDRRLMDLETYAAGVPDAERARWIAMIQEQDARSARIEQQLAELLKRPDRGSAG